MEVEWIKVKIDENEPRSWPMDLVKIRYKLPNRKGAFVRLNHPRYKDGEITLEDMKKLLDYGGRSKIDVYTIEDERVRSVLYIQEMKKAEADGKLMEWLLGYDTCE